MSDSPPEFQFDQDFVDLADATSTPPRWLIQDFLPVGLCVLAGPPKKSMKSTYAIAAAAAVGGVDVQALPKEWRRTGEARKVFIISAEASAGEVSWTAQERLGLKAFPEGHVFVAKEPEKFRLDRDDGAYRLMSHLEYHHPALVVADPFRNLHSQNEDDSGAMFGLLSPWQRWAKANDACFLLVHHVNKSAASARDGNAEYGMLDMRGSGALAGAADGMLIVTPAEMSKEEDAKNAGEGWQVFNTTFKRGASWRKVVRLGEAPKKEKPLSKLEQDVRTFIVATPSMRADVTPSDVTFLATYLKRKEADVAKAIATLKERGML